MSLFPWHMPNRAPELNPMEGLWGQAKDTISANRQYETIEEHVAQLLQHLAAIPDRKALQKAGVFSKVFWLKSALR